MVVTVHLYLSFCQVYCHRMSSKEPREYITLAAGPDQNYATIYGQRLAQPYSCPYIDNRADLLSPRCTNCVSNIYQKAGETRFSKIRFQVENMTVDSKYILQYKPTHQNYFISLWPPYDMLLGLWNLDIIHCSFVYSHRLSVCENFRT